MQRRRANKNGSRYLNQQGYRLGGKSSMIQGRLIAVIHG
jgi:hypothetical protein